jgi:hypothetical protein
MAQPAQVIERRAILALIVHDENLEAPVRRLRFETLDAPPQPAHVVACRNDDADERLAGDRALDAVAVRAPEPVDDFTLNPSTGEGILKGTASRLVGVRLRPRVQRH